MLFPENCLSKQLKKKDKECSENKVKEEAVSCRFKFSVIKYEFVCVDIQMFRSIVMAFFQVLGGVPLLIRFSLGF